MTTSPPEPLDSPELDEPGAPATTLGSPDDATLDDAVLDEAASILDSVAGDLAPELEAEMNSLDSARRLLLVHAHPDDETTSSGVTMAKYAAEGVHVCLVTCTLGEEGEILVPELEHLAATREDGLGRHRIGELSAAMEALGVTDNRFLGGPGRYRDSGMMGEPTNDRPDAFWQADLDEAAALLAAVIREVRPQVLLTYNENGGYGHPDHIQAHRVAMRGVELAAESPADLDIPGEVWSVGKVYYSVMPRSVLAEALRRMQEAGKDFFGMTSAEESGFATDDDLVTAQIDGRDHVPAKLAAMRAHASQIAKDGPFFDMAALFGDGGWGTEYYQLVRGTPGKRGSSGWEEDLFSGLA